MNNYDSTTRSGLIGITTVCLLLIAIGLLTVATSCSDSTTKADKANDKRIEAQAVAMSDDAKDDAKKMAELMVDLASMQQTAFQLSQEATRRATNPQVRTYAQQVLNANAQVTAELRQLAQSMKIELPTTLSDEGKDRVEDLKNAKAGVAFDLKYLDEMEKVSKKSANVAEDLEDDATVDAVKQYGEKLTQSQEQAADALKQLKNVIN